MMKKFILLTLLLIIAMCAAPMVSASEYEGYSELFEESGAAELTDYLPQDAAENMRDAGITSPSEENMTALDISDILNSVMEIAAEESRQPLKAGVAVIAAILLTALLGGLKDSLADIKTAQAAYTAVSVFAALTVLTPLLTYFSDVISTIEGANAFEKGFIPVFAAVLTASGQTVTAAGSAAAILTISEIASSILCGTVVPFVRILTGVSAVTSAAPELNLDSTVTFAEKCVKWLLGILATVVVAALTISGMVTAAADTVAGRTVKFVVSGSVPIIGGAVGEALSSVKSCIALLKTSVGAFGIIACGYIFLPVIIRGVLWRLTLELCASVSDLFGSGSVSKLLRTVSASVGMLLSVCILLLLMLTVSAAAILVVGKAGG